jgi:hypothetical protein
MMLMITMAMMIVFLVAVLNDDDDYDLPFLCPAETQG